jgi:hypothetical protein
MEWVEKASKGGRPLEMFSKIFQRFFQHMTKPSSKAKILHKARKVPLQIKSKH